MQIDVRGRGLTVPEALLGDVEQRLRAAVTRVYPPVRSMVVRIVDDNGPRGGEDKRVVVVATGGSAGSTVVSARGVTILGAVSAAADTLGRAIRNASDRSHGKKRPRDARHPFSRGRVAVVSAHEEEAGAEAV